MGSCTERKEEEVRYIRGKRSLLIGARTNGLGQGKLRKKVGLRAGGAKDGPLTVKRGRCLREREGIYIYITYIEGSIEVANDHTFSKKGSKGVIRNKKLGNPRGNIIEGGLKEIM